MSVTAWAPLPRRPPRGDVIKSARCCWFITSCGLSDVIQSPFISYKFTRLCAADLRHRKLHRSHFRCPTPRFQEYSSITGLSSVNQWCDMTLRDNTMISRSLPWNPFIINCFNTLLFISFIMAKVASSRSSQDRFCAVGISLCSKLEMNCV